MKAQYTESSKSATFSIRNGVIVALVVMSQIVALLWASSAVSKKEIFDVGSSVGLDCFPTTTKLANQSSNTPRRTISSLSTDTNNTDEDVGTVVTIFDDSGRILPNATCDNMMKLFHQINREFHDYYRNRKGDPQPPASSSPFPNGIAPLINYGCTYTVCVA